jgi:hypothetical protein
VQSEPRVFTVRLYSVRRPLSRPGVGRWFMVPLEFAPHHQALACLMDVVASLGEGIDVESVGNTCSMDTGKIMKQK